MTEPRKVGRQKDDKECFACGGVENLDYIDVLGFAWHMDGCFSHFAEDVAFEIHNITEEE